MTGTIEIVYTGSLESGETAVLLLDLKVDSVEDSPFNVWAEISEDSGDDEDSTPDAAPSADAVNHNDVTLDDPAGDEDDSDNNALESAGRSVVSQR